MKAASGWIKPAAVVGLVLTGHLVSAIDLDPSFPDSIRDAAKAVAQGLVWYYPHGEAGNVPGLLPRPYEWSEGGMMLGALIDYWHYTGDDQFNDMVLEGMAHQTGPGEDYQPLNSTQHITNAGQAAWALSAMAAAEHSFPSGDSIPSWENLARNVFNSIVPRWDTENCDGGFRGSPNSFDRIYDYKDSLSNAFVFELSSRLARLQPKNQTYTDWADKIWQWSESVGFISERFAVYDGALARGDCGKIDQLQWTANTGAYLAGAANMYNLTNGDSEWRSRVQSLIKRQEDFFKKDNVMEEFACDSIDTCNSSQRFYKGLLARAFGVTLRVAPFTKEAIIPRIQASAKAAANVCVVDGDDTDEVTCGSRWTTDKPDGHDGIGESMGALQIIQANLYDAAPPVKPDASPTSSEGGNSPTKGSGETATGTPDDSGSFRSGVGWQQSSLVILGLFLAVSASV